MNRTVIMSIIAILLPACSSLDKVLPDTRTEYEKAESLPDLEIPPDLTADAINDSMMIPGERGRASLSARSRSAAGSAIKQAEIRRLDSTRSLLYLPEELEVAWTEIEKVLVGAGIEINEKDPEKGIFDITYTPDAGEKKGFFSRLAFWKGGSESYLINMTGEDGRTELVILDKKGEWATDEEAEVLLATIRTQYNVSKANRNPD